MAFFALLATLGLTACEGGTPTSVPTEVSRNLPPPDDGECCYGGGGGTTNPPPPPQYRVYGEVYKIQSGPQASITQVKIRGWSRFEKLVGTDWVKIDADYLEVKCYGGGTYDEDDESPAGFTDVEFWTQNGQFGAAFTAQCTHKARFQGVEYNTTSSSYMQFI
jgi:hypothetical protein